MVLALWNSIEQAGFNPFSKTDDFFVNKKLINIASGVIATAQTQIDILGASAKGREKRDSFLREVLTLDGKGSYQAPITKLNLHTFGRNEANKPKGGNKNGKPVSAASRTGDFLLLISSYQFEVPSISVNSALSYPLQDIPAMMGNLDGSFYTSKKADLKKIIARYEFVNL